MNNVSNISVIRDSVTRALELNAPLVLDYEGGDCILTCRGDDLLDAWEHFDMGNGFELHTGFVALIEHAQDRADWEQLEALVTRRVRRGGNPDDSADLLAELLSAHTGGNLATALHYNDFATEARTLRIATTR